MKRLALLVVLFVLCLAPQAEAQGGRTYQCLLKNTCAPPPCEFWERLKYAKAVQRAASRTPANLRSADLDAIDQYLDRYFQSVKDAQKQYSKCPVNYIPPEFTLTKDCQIYPTALPQGEPVPADPVAWVKARAGGCSEFVDAEYSASQAAQLVCDASKDLPKTVRTVQIRRTYEANRRVRELEEQLANYMASCTPDAATPRVTAAAGVAALNKIGGTAQTAARAR